VKAPGENGEITFTGRLGYSACAIEEAGNKALNTAIVFNFLRLISPFSDEKFILSPVFFNNNNIVMKLFKNNVQ